MTNNDKHYRNALPEGSMLEEFRLLKVLGDGGFGITYLAEDTTLEQEVAIKEYLPNDIAVREGSTVHPKTSDEQGDYAWGLERFEQEAKTLARFRHPNLVQVRRFFRGNNTAYMVMEYEDGRSLDKLIEDGRTLEEDDIRKILLPLLDGLEVVHAAGVLHRDIKPANIYIRRKDESPVLLDFGAARQAIGRRSKSVTSVVSPGYSPFEQYESKGEQGQGPWSDIYSLGAVCYRLISGKTPEEATKRVSSVFRGDPDPQERLFAGSKARPGYSQALLSAVDHAMCLKEKERPQAIGVFREELGVTTVPSPSHPQLTPLSPGKKKQRWRKVVGVMMLVAGVAGYMVWNQQRVETEQREQAFVELVAQADSAVRASNYAEAEGSIAQAELLGLHPEQISERKRDLARHKEKVRQQEEVKQAKLAKEAAEEKLQEERRRQQEAEEVARAALEQRQKEEAEAAAIRKQEEEAAQAAQAKQEREEATRKLQEQVEKLREEAKLKEAEEFRLREQAQAVALKKQEAEAAAIRKQEEEAAQAAKAKREAEQGLALEMVSVKGGTFRMGCGPWTSECRDEEKPVHEVRVGDFRIGKYEVTQGQWRAVMGNNPSHFSSCGDNCPVENVSWNDVQGFLGKLHEKTGKGYRLPTEAEWEYACRSGGKEEEYCGGSEIERLAWYDGNSGRKTHVVGGKAANGLGLYDMSGNVWEYCSDWYGTEYYATSPQTDPTGPSSGSDRVDRGGSWNLNPAYVRAAYRNGSGPASRRDYLGFRLVLPPGQ